MADERNNPSTHFGSLASSFRTATTAPVEPIVGDFYYDNSLNKMCIFNGAKWVCASFSTTTSTSTSLTTTSTSTSLTTTSTSITTTSISISTTTSISTSTSTTTTL